MYSLVLIPLTLWRLGGGGGDEAEVRAPAANVPWAASTGPDLVPAPSLPASTPCGGAEAASRRWAAPASLPRWDAPATAPPLPPSPTHT